MPSSNGIHSLPPGYLAVTGNPILASQHNPPLEDLSAGLTARLSRDGTAPMLGALKGISGTAALPGYVFATDASTGFLKTASGIGVSIAGTQVAEITAAGIASGVWSPGMLLPFSGSTAPNSLWVIPVGQTLSRATYTALWTFAQGEIASGSAFYNNGNGSTTFGIADMRGRVIAASDPSGLVLPTNGVLIGAGAGGSATHVLTTAEMPSHSHGVTEPNAGAGHQHITGPAGTFKIATTAVNVAGGAGNVVLVDGGVTISQLSTGLATTGITINNAGSGNAHSIVQPTLICNYILFVGG